MSEKESPVALVTGGGRGIGRACAARLLSRGYRVAVIDRDEQGLASARDLPGAESRLETIHADLSEDLQIQECIRRTVERFGRLDAVVNNAAVSAPSRVSPEELPLEEWQRVIATNLTAPFLIAKYAVPALRESRGAIVNIASTRALQSEPGSEAYAASKGGLVVLTHALAVSLGPLIRVNAISPGWIDVSDPPEHLSAEDHSQHPAGRVGRPEDIAAMVEYLLSPQAEFITGQNLIIDGGMTRKMIYRES